jgi:murein L,D-transpeptidase YafK
MNTSANTPAPVPASPSSDGSSNRRIAEQLGRSATITPPPPVEDRVAFARSRHGESIKKHCTEAGLNYPPQQLFLRAFKHEGEVEAWGCDKSEPMKLIKTWSLTAQSGAPGPKRREGDRQIPEGCYRIVVFNPKSDYHLSMGLDYPNAADRVHSDKEKPGFDIYIHGSDRSIGCLAIGDDMIEELYLLAADFRSKQRDAIPVHIFPVRMQGTDWNALCLEYPQHVNFWAELEPIYMAFENSHRVPSVSVNDAGTYVLED